MKKRPKRDLCNQGLHKDILARNKEKLYERQQHRCPHCGREMDFCQMELHHILPVGYQLRRLRGEEVRMVVAHGGSFF